MSTDFLDALSHDAEVTEASIEGLSSSLETLGRVGGDAGEVLHGLGGALADLSHGDIVGVLTNLHGAAEALAQMSVEADRQTAALHDLGDGMDAISRRTNDTVDETDAWRMQQRLLTAGLHATGEELASVAGFAREYALTHGVSAAEATERLTSALIRGSQGGLRPFGIEVDHNATRAENWHAALEHMTTTLDHTALSARTASEDIHRFDRELGDATNALARSAAEAIHLRGILEGLTDLVQNTGGVASAIGHSVVGAAHAVLGDVRGAAEEFAQIDAAGNAARARNAAAEAAQATASHDVIVATNEARARGLDLSRVQLHNAEDMVQLTNTLRTYQHDSLEVQQQQINAIGEQRRLEALRARDRQAYEENAQTQAANELGPPAHTRTTHHRGGHGGVGQHVSEEERHEQQLRQEWKRQAFAAETRAMEEAYDEQERATAAFAAFMDALDADATNHQRHQEARAEEKRLSQEHEAEQRRAIEMQIELVHHITAAEHTQMQSMSLVQLARLNDVRHAQSYAEQMKSVYEMLAGGTESSAQRMSGAIKGQLSSMEGAFEQHLGAIIEGNENAGEALKKFTHTVLLQTAVKATVLSAEEFAAGFAMVARAAGSYGADVGAESSASGHFIAGGIYAGIAGGSAAGAYATNPSKSAGGGSGSVPSMASRANYGPANDNAHGGRGDIYVTVEGSIIDTASFDRHVGNAQERNWGSRQVPGYQRTRS
jgi:hypothetical protein